VGAVGLLGGVAGQLGAVQRDGADADHAGGGINASRFRSRLVRVNAASGC
jgi:hypothetical protein